MKPKIKFTYKKFIFLFIFIINLKYTNNIKQKLFNSYGMKYAKTYKLNNGNIIIVGDSRILTYDKNGLILLYNCSYIDNSIIKEPKDALYTTFAQFPEEYNSIVIICVNHIIYILNSNGQFQSSFKLTHDTTNVEYYSIVPHTYKEGNYYFILGYITREKYLLLQYFSFNNNFGDLKDLYDYELIKSEYGISCQIMNHYMKGEVLTCFYLKFNPSEIFATSFKIENNKIEQIEKLNTSFEEAPFCLLSEISPDRKKSILCYIQNKVYNIRNGYCAIYDIDENKFEKYGRYLPKNCDSGINHITLNYFHETREYIFTCSNSSSPEISIARFDQNFNIIQTVSNGKIKNSTIMSMNSTCGACQYYSFIVLSNEYKILGDFNCQTYQETRLYSLPPENAPKTIYNDQPSYLNDIQLTELTVDSIEDSTNITKFKCNGYKNNNGSICSDDVPNGYYILDQYNKILGECYIFCHECLKGPEENNNNCLNCKDNFELKNNNCLYKYKYYYDKVKDEIIYLQVEQLCPEKYPYEIIETKECKEYCSNQDFINKKCKINYYSENNINSITNNIRNIINEKTDSNFDVIIDGNNIIYEITASSANHEHYNISSIDFGECENILKKHYSIDYLLVFKIDIKLNDSYPTSVEYEVYNPYTKQKLELSLCENHQIDIYIPIHLDNYTSTRYNHINQFGYDILDRNNSFFNDICTTFTTDYGTDISLFDRKIEYFNENITLCEKYCTYISYNNTNGKAKCQCPLKNKISEIKTISYDKFDIQGFLDIKTISNIDIMKCFKLTFSLNGLNKNFGNIIIIIFIALYIILIIVYHLNEKREISRLLYFALKASNFTENPPHKNKRSLKFKHNKKMMEKKLNEVSGKQNSQSILNLMESNQNLKNKNNNTSNTNNNNNQFQIKNYQSINIIDKASFIFQYNKEPQKFKEKTKNKKKKRKSKNIINPVDKKNKTKNIIKTVGNKFNYNQKYTDQELNILSFDEALILDKRSYIKYYWSLLKNKHIILFVFMPSEDYNLVSLKISLLLFSFCLYFTINAAFFTDKTMHKIYEDKGIFNFLYQLPQIAYSTLISSVLNILLRFLALSEKNIIDLKAIKIKNKAREKTVKLYRYLMIKFKLFYIISLLILKFFWYYLSTFCAVYKNTQIILIKNTIISFALTLLYPFALYLLPAIFRISALKFNKKSMECIYIF